jgi:hypothetical protein
MKYASATNRPNDSSSPQEGVRKTSGNPHMTDKT